MSVPTATRLSSVDFARVIAMVAVILIHVTSTYINAESSVALWGINLAFFLNQAARFCVPLFLFLSGLSLGLGRKDLPGRPFIRTGLCGFCPPTSSGAWSIRCETAALTRWPWPASWRTPGGFSPFCSPGNLRPSSTSSPSSSSVISSIPC